MKTFRSLGLLVLVLAVCWFAFRSGEQKPPYVTASRALETAQMQTARVLPVKRSDAPTAGTASTDSMLQDEERHSIAAQIHAARRWFAQTLRADGGAALVAMVDGPAGFAFEADARGVEVLPQGGASWAWKLKPADARPAAPRAEKERLSYERGAGVTEWFVNGADGIEHGYTLAAGNGAAVRKVSAVVETGLRAVPRAGRDGVDFLDESGAARLHYDGLMAFDAVGRKLEAWMEVEAATITLAVNTTGARFPVTIDPVISLAGAVIQPSPVEAADAFATSMDVAGDLLAVGDPARDVPGNVNGGAAFVFKRDAGTAFGWSQVANLTLPAAVRAFGKKVAVGGNLLAVACEHDDPAPGVIDEVRLYTLDSAGAATPLTTLVIGENVAGFDHSVEVSADGSMVAVGSTSLRYNGDPGELRAGRVLIFGRDEGGPGNWGNVTALQTPTYAAGTGFGFGHSLSLSGDWLAVGAPSLLGERVFVYSRSGSVWTLDETFTPPAVTAPVAVEGFGQTVALHGTRLAIGAPFSNSNGELSGFNAGRVIVAERRANGSWVTGSLLPVPSNFGEDQFGAVLSMSASQLSIAGPGGSSLWTRKSFTSSDAADGWSLDREDSLSSLGLSAAITSLHQSDDTVLTGSATAGQIVARRLVATNWPITAQFTEGSAAHLAGAVLARDGDLLAIGAPGDTGTHDRSVYVLRRNTAAAPGQEWTLAHTFTDNSARFGSSLALKDGILLIGAPGIGTGVVLSYRRQNAAATSWTTAQLLFPPVTFPAAAFGTAIAFNGVFAVVGDPLASSGRGGAFVFQRPASGEWPVVMGGTVAAPYLGYGAAVAITEANHFIVGAPQTPVLEDFFPADGGAAFVWRYEPVSSSLDASAWTPAWTLDQHLYPDGSVSARSDGRFGASVAMQGQQAFIGAPGDGTAAQRGRAFVFRRDETPLPPADPVPTQVPWRQIATIFPSNLTDTPPEAPFFGHALALNAAHVVIGAPGGTTHAGQVFVYSAAPSGLLWAPIARMLAPASAVGDGFGSAVAAPMMDEIAVGAPGTGVSIFTKQLSEWRLVRNVPTQTQVFTNLLPLGFGEGPLAVGTAMATDGDWLVVGAPRVIHTTSSGVAPVLSVVDPWKQVFVLHRRSQAGIGSDAWETTTVLAFGGTTWSYATSMNDNITGLSVDISGRNVIVGQGSNLDNGGIARIARLNADGTQPQVELTPDGYLLNEGFEFLQTAGGSNLVGHAVTISGSYAAVGNGDGGAHIYEWRGWHDPQLVGGGLEGTRQWKLVKTLTSPHDGFGSAVALDGLRLAVGADLYRNEAGGRDGIVIIFERDLGGSNNWGLRAERELPFPISEEGSYLGMGSALALEGDTLVAGAKGRGSDGYNGLPNGNVRTFGTGGTAFVFERHFGGTDNWGFTAWLSGSDSIGVSVAISGDIIALGSPGGVFQERQEHPQLPGFYNLIGPYFQRGKVTLFHRHQKHATLGAVEAIVPAWGDMATFEQENSDTAHTFNFGSAVALTGGTLAIGARGTYGPTPGYGFNPSPTTPGRAFVYDLKTDIAQQWHDLWRPDDPTAPISSFPNSSTVTLTSSDNPAIFGNSVTFTATVTELDSQSITPTGSVFFTVDGTLGSPVSVNGSGVATFTTSALSVATHTITATYSGDALLLPSTSNTVSQSVQGLIASNGNDSGPGSLRQALISAALSPGPDIITLSSNLNGQTLTLSSELLVDDSSGSVTIDASGLSSGFTLTDAGDVNHRLLHVQSGSTLIVRGVTFLNGGGASFTGNGGAILNEGSLTLDRCTLSGCEALAGGGLFSGTGSILTMSQCTLTHNFAATAAGLLTDTGSSATLVHCTVAGGSASVSCSGVLARGTLSLQHCILGQNSGAEVPPVDLKVESGTTTLKGVNLIEKSTGTVVGPPAIATMPLLNAFGSYGGSTPTMPPLPGSPALDQASVLSPALITDQRGLPRPLGVRPDIGAVEGPVIVVTTAVDELNAAGFVGAGVSLREAIRDVEAGGIIAFDRAVFNSTTTNTITLTRGPLNPQRSCTLSGALNPGGIKIVHAPTITGQPMPLSVASGAPASFAVTVTNLSGGVAYQWRKDGSDLGSQTAAALNLTNVQEVDQALYDVRLSEAAAPGTLTLNNVVLTAFAATSQAASLIVDGAPVTIQRSPSSAMLALGSNYKLSINAIGPAVPALTYQWKKNGTNISGATQSSYVITNAKLTHAGAYTCLVKSGTVLPGVPSSTAEIGVVDAHAKTVNLAAGGTFTPTVSAAGNGLTFVWKRDATTLPSVLKTFPINPVTIGDAGLYTCTVTGLAGTITTGFNTRLNVSSVVPTLVLPLTLPAATIGQAYFYQIPVQSIAGAPATVFNITGALPSGMTYSSVTGIISGRPTVTKPTGYPLIIKAGNTKGFGPTATVTLTVNAVPATAVGTFAGPMVRSALNDHLGGLFDLTTTTTGLCSGSVTLGARAKISFTNQLLLSAGSGDVILRANIPGITLADTTVLIAYLEVFAVDQRAVLTLVHPVNGTTLIVPAWRNPWNTTTNKATPYAGYYTARLNAGVGGTAAPSGYGYASFTVSTAGTLTFAGKLPDGSALTGGSFVSKDGEIAIFNLLYATNNRGSHVGQFNITPNTPVTNNVVGGETTWSKPAPLTVITTDTVYKSGFGPLAVTATGAPYVAPAKGAIVPGFTAVAAGQTNAKLNFSLGGLDVEGKEFTQLLRIANPSVTGLTNTATIATPIANTTKLTSFTASSGRFAGSFTINGATAALNRPAPFYGQLVKIGATTQGYGYHLLPTVPVPPKNVTTSPKLSGRVVLGVP